MYRLIYMLDNHFMGYDETYYPLEEVRTDYEPFDEVEKQILSRIRSKTSCKEDDKRYESTYELTLTTTKDDPYELRQYARKIADSAIYAVIDMPYCIELTEKGLPHIHAVIYSTKKYLDASKIKTLKFPYRYELKRVRNLESYLNYIKKEKDNPTIIDYCKKKGIQQFDNAVQKEISEKTQT